MLRAQLAQIKARFQKREPKSFRLRSGLPDWESLLATRPDLWAKAKETARYGPHVLIATHTGGHGPVSVVESMLAVALTLRGARVHTLLCDGALPGCLQAQYGERAKPSLLADYKLNETLCLGCFARGRAVFHAIDLDDHHTLSNLVSSKERAEARSIAAALPADEIGSFEMDGLALGEHAMAGALRYYARGDLETEPLGETVARRYLEAAILTRRGIDALLDRYPIEQSVFHHGIYIPQGVVGEVCRKRSVPVANWVVAYRQNTVIFSHDDTYHHTLLSEPLDAWERMAFGEAEEQAVVDYLESRRQGSRDWIYFHEKPDDDVAVFAEKVGLDLEKPIIGMLTNVFWDAQLHYQANAFDNMLDWCLATIAYFKNRPDLQLLIRVHPAEIRGTARSRQPLVDEFEKHFPEMPKNVFILPPESPISTYAAMECCDSVLIYGTKTGVELSSVGMPVIVAGEAWIRGKGVTTDVARREDYETILDRLPLGHRLPEATTRRARQYAYHFFFRRMLPLPFLASDDSGFHLEIDSLDDLMPGRHEGLDVICRGLLDQTPFIYPAERLGIHDL